jgi:MFS family permease
LFVTIKVMRNSFSSLKVRNFRLYFFGQIISNTGNWLTNVAIILLVLKLTHSGFDVGVLAACSFGPILLLTAWAGAVVDRSNKRHFLLLTQSLEMLQSFGLAALAFMHHPPLAGLYALAIVGGIFLAFDNPIRRSFVSEMVPGEQIPNAVVLYSLVVNISRIFGPALAGLLVVTTGFGWCFTLDALSYLVVIGCILRMRPGELFSRPMAAKTKGAVREAIQYIRSSPVLWINFVMLTSIGVFSYNFNVTLPLFVTSALHGSTTSFTILYSIFSAGAVLGGLIIARRNAVQLHHVIVGAFALGGAMIILAGAPGTRFALPAGFLLGLASIMYMTATTTIVQVRSRPEMVARVLALQAVLLFGTTPVGGPLLGWLSDTRGGRTPILLGGIVAVGTGFFGYYANKRFVRSAAMIS